MTPTSTFGLVGGEPVDLSAYALAANVVPTTRTLTINGTAFDLSANRSWTIATGPSFGTTTQIPYMNAGGTDFLYGAGLTYDGTYLLSPSIIGSSADNGDITIQGTSSATKTTSYVILQPTGGNVGIGTTSPGAKLHIVSGADDALQIDRYTGYASIKAGSTNGYMMIDSAGQALGLNWYVADNVIIANGGGNVGIGYANPGTAKLAINGNVGIGTTSPTVLLEVGGTHNDIGGVTTRAAIVSNSNSVQSFHLENLSSGTAAEMRFVTRSDDANYMAFTSPSSGNTGTFFGATKSTGNFIFSSARPLYIGTISDSDILFGRNNATVSMVIKGVTGNVGIGTTAPSNPLTIYNTAALAPFKMATGNVDMTFGGNGGPNWAANADFSTSAWRYLKSSQAAIVMSLMPNGQTTGDFAISTAPSGTAGNTITWTQRLTVLEAGNVGIGTTTPRTKLELGNDGAILAIGTTSTGWTEPSLGAGTRLLWYPRAGAFRAGTVTGTQWDAANIGSYSVAAGLNTKATGVGSFAVGNTSIASAHYANAMGENATAGGLYSLAVGYYNSTGGDSSLSVGSYTHATGKFSTAIGKYTTALSDNTFALGQGVDNSNHISNNIAGSLMVGFNSNIPTLFVGPSAGVGTTGNVGIGTTTPGEKLEVNGNIQLTVDNNILKFGTGEDAQIYYDATNLVINPRYVGTGYVSITGGLKTDGGRIGKVTTVTDTYQILITDETVICNKTTAFTITLPTAVVGQIFNIKNINTGIVTIEGNGTDTIDGESNQSVNQWECIEVICYVANKWGII